MGRKALSAILRSLVFVLQVNTFPNGRGKARKSKSKGEMGLRMYSLIKLFDIAILYLETKPKCLRMSFLGLS